MAYDYQKKYICPRLVDYVLIVGSKNPNHNDSVAQTPELLRRYPLEDHKDFPLSPDIVFFCQPEGCISVGPKRLMLRESTSFVFTLTDKDSGKTRYGICISFYRPFERRLSNRNKAGRNTSQISTSSGEAPPRATIARTIPRPQLQTSDNKISPQDSFQNSTRSRKPKYPNRLRNHTLTSMCLISHHPFFCSFREILFTLKKFIECCSERSCGRKIGSSKNMRDTVWGVLTGLMTDNCPNVVMHDVREIELWILRLLSAPVPVPGKTRVELFILPNSTHHPMVFANPDHTRFSLIDFPLHLPLELLGVDTCLRVLVLIMLENKIILQSRDYNALSMSVLAFISLMYPLEYMFPVIPLLPTCMNNAEQLLLVPTPYLIGLPSSFLMYKKGFKIPDDVWLVDLDQNKIFPPEHGEEIPELPEPEGSILKNHLKQALASMSGSAQPIINMESIATADIKLDFRPQQTANEFNPLIYGNDMDSIDVATRVAMVRFFNSPNILGNYSEHSRTLRLYPRPVVAFQLNGFLKSRPNKTKFINRLARTQAVEYFVEWALSPTNSVFLRIHMNIFDPSIIGDKAKWFSQNLQKIDFHVYDQENSSLGDALNACVNIANVDIPTDESGSDSDGANSSSSYSSLSEFVDDMQISSINGETPTQSCEDQQFMPMDILKVFHPQTKLQLPDDELDHPSNKSQNSDNDDSEASSDSEKNFEMDVNTSSQQSTITEQKKIEEISFDKPRRPPPPSVNALKANSIDKQYPTSVSAPNTAPITTDHPSFFPSKQNFMPTKNVLNKSSSDENKSSIRNPFSSSTFTNFFGEGFKQKLDKIDIEKISETVSESVRETGMKVREVREKAEVIMSETLSEAGGTKSTILTSKSAKHFTPLGNRKSLSEKSSGSLKHTPIQLKNEQKRDSMADQRSLQHAENQQFLKEVCASVFEGRGVSFFKMGRIKKLTEDENYRNFIVSRLNTSLEKKLSDEHQHLEDVCISKQVFKGMLTLLKALIQGLEVTYQSQGPGGMSSAMMVLEIIHTHFFEKEGSNKSEASNQSLASSPFGSSEALSMTTEQKLAVEDQIPSASDVEGFEDNMKRYSGKDLSIDLLRKSQTPYIGLETCGNQQRDSSGYISEGGGDLLRDMVKNKVEMLSQKAGLHKVNSIESDMSDSSLLTNTIKKKKVPTATLR